MNSKENKRRIARRENAKMVAVEPKQARVVCLVINIMRRCGMTLEALMKLIADYEGETVEVREATGQCRNACETLCAFLNKDGEKIAVWHDFLSAA